MSKRAERKAREEDSDKLVEHLQQQFHWNIPGPLSDFYNAIPYLAHADPRLQSLPISLTSLETMWLLDLRELPDETQQKDKKNDPSKKSSQRPSVTRKPQTHVSLNTKTR